MFERFTDQARDALVHAHAEARRLGDSTIDPGHLLLGLLAVDNSIAQSALTDLGITAQALRANRSPGPAAPAGRIPFERETKAVLEHALGQSIALGHPTLTTGDLLLGVVADADRAARVGLTAVGTDFDTVLATVLREHASGGPEVGERPSFAVWGNLRMGSAPDRLPGRRAGVAATISALLWYAALTAAITAITWDEVGPETFGAVLIVSIVALGLLIRAQARRITRRLLALPRLALDPPEQVIALLERRGIAVEIRVQANARVHDRCYRMGSRAWIVLATRTMLRPQQLAFVLAHEVAHLVRNDSARRRVPAAVGPALLLSASLTFDPRAYVIAWCGGIGYQIASRWWMELACDAFATRWTGAAALRAWADDHRALLREPHNRTWRRRVRRTFNLMTHPPLALRKAMCSDKPSMSAGVVSSSPPAAT